MRSINGSRAGLEPCSAALTLAEFGNAPVEDLFFQANSFPGKRVADPFMGGGTPLIEANRLGCDVLGLDINPMAAWIVREEIEHLDLRRLRDSRRRAARMPSGLILDALYRTDCPHLWGQRCAG